MNFHLKCRHMDCPDDLEQAITEKVQRFERMVKDTAYMEIELVQLPKAQNGGDKQAEVVLDIPGLKPVIRFTAGGTTFLEAVDQVLDHLDEHLSRQRDKLTDHSYHGPSLKERVADQMNRNEL